MDVNHIYFPPMLRIFDLEHYATQWWCEDKVDDNGNCIEEGGGYVDCIEDSGDFYEGEKLCGPPDAYLNANGGLTAMDREWIQDGLNIGTLLGEMWE